MNKSVKAAELQSKLSNYLIAMTSIFVVTTASAGFSSLDHFTVSETMKKHGFRCSSVSDTGLTCIGKIPEYPRDIAIVIPAEFKAEEKLAVILNIHGDNRPNNSIRWYLKQFQFQKLLSASGRNAIMFIPLSFSDVYSPTSDFQNCLANNRCLVNVMSKLLKISKDSSLSNSAELKSLILTSHSGGYRTVARIIDNKSFADQLKEIYLFDSTYGQYDAYISFANNPDNRLWSAFKFKGTLDRKTSCIMRLFDNAQIPYFGCRPILNPVCEENGDLVPSRDPSGRRLPSKRNISCAPKTAFSNEDLRTNRIGFLSGTEDHYGIFNTFFSDLLKPLN